MAPLRMRHSRREQPRCQALAQSNILNTAQYPEKHAFACPRRREARPAELDQDYIRGMKPSSSNYVSNSARDSYVSPTIAHRQICTHYRYFLILVWINCGAAGHRHTERTQRVQNADCSGVRGQNLGQTPICLWRFVHIAAPQLHPAFCHPF
jgi:hypothetical protein